MTERRRHSLKGTLQLSFSTLLMFAALLLTLSTDPEDIARTAGTRLLIIIVATLPFVLAVAATYVLTRRKENTWHVAWLMYLCLYAFAYYFLHPNAGYLASTYLGVEILGILFVVAGGLLSHLILLLVWTVMLFEKKAN